MVWFIIIFSLAVIFVFFSGIFMIKIRQHREVNTDFDEKLTRIEKRFDPKIKFVVNLFGWILAFLVIYYIYLG